LALDKEGAVMVDNGGRDSGVLAIKKNCDFLSLSSGFFLFFLFFFCFSLYYLLA